MATNFRITDDRLKEVTQNAEKALRSAVAKAADAGESEARGKVTEANQAREYNLPVDDIQSEADGMEARVFATQPYWPYFEYGTVFIDPVPFIRPARQAMAEAFSAEVKRGLKT